MTGVSRGPAWRNVPHIPAKFHPLIRTQSTCVWASPEHGRGYHASSYPGRNGHRRPLDRRLPLGAGLAQARNGQQLNGTLPAAPQPGPARAASRTPGPPAIPPLGSSWRTEEGWREGGHPSADALCRCASWRARAAATRKRKPARTVLPLEAATRSSSPAALIRDPEAPGTPDVGRHEWRAFRHRRPTCRRVRSARRKRRAPAQRKGRERRSLCALSRPQSGRLGPPRRPTGGTMQHDCRRRQSRATARPAQEVCCRVS